MGFMLIHDLINPETGNTYKQDNLKLKHNIPIGTLVEVKFDRWHGDGACMKIHARLWVVNHDRDCDGTPLYDISRWKDPNVGRLHDCFHGFTESALTPIELTPRIVEGWDALEWEDDTSHKTD